MATCTLWCRRNLVASHYPDICELFPVVTGWRTQAVSKHWSCLNIVLLLLSMLLRRIFGPKRDENGEWRRLHNEELHSLYRSPNVARVIKSRRLRWAGHVARMQEGRSAFKILTGKPTGKRPLGRPRRRWVDNIRMDLEEIGINAGNWVDWAQDRNYWRALVNAALNLRVP